MQQLKNKVIWITGASGGIGEALAYAFSKEGARLVLTARNAEKLEVIAEKCRQSGVEVLVVPLDVTDLMALEQAAKEVQEIMKQVDVLVLNAGRSQRSLAVETPLSIDRTLMELNFFSPVALTKALLPGMLERKAGHLVVISSLAGKFGVPRRTAYCSSKHALQGFYEALRAELAATPVQVTILSPGRIQTEISLHALNRDGQEHGTMDKGQLDGMPVELCAAKILSAVKNNRKDVLIGRKELIMYYIHKWLPGLYYRLIPNIQ
ncbi:MAG: SDR family oxidoreductase [Lewinellaceae bacterium]|nr:SDR family oxidoreductase [Lewinellaceae bacterium]HPR01299.1 SDR family oxidoreductase [Saprospiraceae bacterium]